MNLMVAIAAGIGLVWSTVLVLRGPLLVMAAATLVMGCCFGHDFASFKLGPVPLTMDRLALMLLLAAYAGQRWLGRAERKPLGRTEWLLLGLIAVLAVSMLTHDFSAGDANEGSPTWRLIAGYLIPLSLYWIGRQAPLRERPLVWMHGLLAVFGIYLCVTALAEITQQWWLVYPRYIADPKVGLHFGRARGPMVMSVTLGVYLAAGLLSSWYVLRRWGRHGWLLLAAIFPLYLGAMFYSYTRSVWMGGGLAVLIVLAVSLKGRWRIMLLGGAVASMLLVGLTLSDRILGFEREGPASDTRDSASMRTSFTYVSWQMFLDRPIWGVGFGQFPKAKLRYLNDRSVPLELQRIRELVHHNTLLSLLTETGLIGLGMFLAVLIAWALGAWSLIQNDAVPGWARAQALLTLALLGVLCCQLMFHELSYSPLDHGILFLMAGITSGLSAKAGRLPQRDKEDLAVQRHLAATVHEPQAAGV
jgi:O-antigen ligase